MYKIIFILLMAFMLSACENPLSKEDAVVTPAPVITPMEITVADLVGTWKTACVYTASSGLAEQATMVFTSTALTGTFILYSDRNCAGAIFRQVSIVDHTLGSQAQGDAGAYDIDWTTTSTTATSNNSAITTEFNNESLCGISTWSTNVAKDITGLTCNGAAMSSNGDVIFDIILLASPGNVLYLTTVSLESSSARDLLTRSSLTDIYYKQ